MVPVEDPSSPLRLICKKKKLGAMMVIKSIKCCNADSDLLLSACLKEGCCEIEITPGRNTIEFVNDAIDAHLKREFKGRGLGKRRRGKLAGLVFG
jgi:hypothetical protein